MHATHAPAFSLPAGSAAAAAPLVVLLTWPSTPSSQPRQSSQPTALVLARFAHAKQSARRPPAAVRSAQYSQSRV
jgi:hypothetical protein